MPDESESKPEDGATEAVENTEPENTTSSETKEDAEVAKEEPQQEEKGEVSNEPKVVG